MINLVGMLTADLILAQVRNRPDFGEEHMVDHMTIRAGALANTLFPLAKLGVKQNVFSILGKDEFGDQIYNELSPMIENDIRRSDTPTMLSVSVVKEGGARYFVTYSGNAYEFTPSLAADIKPFGEAKALMLYGYFLAPAFGPEGALACLEGAKAAGQLTFFDANSAIDGWSEKSRQEIYSFLPYIDYFMPNDEELLKLTGASSEAEAVDMLRRRGARTVVVKRGADGAAAYPPNGPAVRHPGFRVEAYDTTGAGDSFNAGFMYSVLNQADLHRALAFGNALASIVVSRKEDRYPALTEIEEKLEAKLHAN
mgnify:CR=1 FL=1|jgi:Sugar kinases, ribokinase family